MKAMILIAYDNICIMDFTVSLQIMSGYKTCNATITERLLYLNNWEMYEVIPLRNNDLRKLSPFSFQHFHK